MISSDYVLLSIKPVHWLTVIFSRFPTIVNKMILSVDSVISADSILLSIKWVDWLILWFSADSLLLSIKWFYRLILWFSADSILLSIKWFDWLILWFSADSSLCDGGAGLPRNTWTIHCLSLQWCSKVTYIYLHLFRWIFYNILVYPFRYFKGRASLYPKSTQHGKTVICMWRWIPT